ncbi:hypothetical protein Ancab_016175, partial [Ancistrocladus abbreviatus]
MEAKVALKACVGGLQWAYQSSKASDMELLEDYDKLLDKMVDDPSLEIYVRGMDIIREWWSRL